MSCDCRKIIKSTDCGVNGSHTCGIFELEKCIKSTRAILKTLHIFDKNFELPEHDLILMRLKMYPNMEKFKYWKICAATRDQNGKNLLLVFFFTLNNFNSYKKAAFLLQNLRNIVNIQVTLKFL